MHNHHHESHETKNIRTAFILNLLFALLEFVGGFYLNSLAIISNALHDAGDALTIGLSWGLSAVARKGRTPAFSYGYLRFSPLTALINGFVILTGSVIILYHSVPRIFHPEPASTGGMFIFAVAGVVINGVAAFRLKGGGTMNERIIMLHLIEDVLGWSALLVVSVVMIFVNAPQLDPILAVLITLFIIWNAVKNLKATMMIFMQGVPEAIDIAEMEQRLLGLDGVKGIHDLHIWSLDGLHHVASLHAVVEKPLGVVEMVEIKNKIRKVTVAFRIDHATIEVECGEKDCMVRLDS